MLRPLPLVRQVLAPHVPEDWGQTIILVHTCNLSHLPLCWWRGRGERAVYYSRYHRIAKTADDDAAVETPCSFRHRTSRVGVVSLPTASDPWASDAGGCSLLRHHVTAGGEARVREHAARSAHLLLLRGARLAAVAAARGVVLLFFGGVKHFLVHRAGRFPMMSQIRERALSSCSRSTGHAQRPDRGFIKSLHDGCRGPVIGWFVCAQVPVRKLRSVATWSVGWSAATRSACCSIWSMPPTWRKRRACHRCGSCVAGILVIQTQANQVPYHGIKSP